MRTFIAFSVPSVVRDYLQTVQRTIRMIDRKMPVRLSPPENFHITLEFIGELENEQVEEVKSIVKTAAERTQPTPVWLERLDGFPSLSDPRILVVRIGEEKAALNHLHDTVRAELLARKLITPDHEWHPHITLGRVSHAWHHEAPLHTIEIERKVWTVNEIFVMKSEHQDGRSEYTILGHYPLSAGV